MVGSCLNKHPVSQKLEYCIAKIMVSKYFKLYGKLVIPHEKGFKILLTSDHVYICMYMFELT